MHSNYTRQAIRKRKICSESGVVWPAGGERCRPCSPGQRRAFVLLSLSVFQPFSLSSRKRLQKDFFFSLQGEKIALLLAAILLQ
jgi:hypothetical protein